MERRPGRLWHQPYNADPAEDQTWELSMKASPILVAIFVALGSSANAASWERTSNGVSVTPTSGPEKSVRLEIYGDRIIRVTETQEPRSELRPSLAVVGTPSATPFSASQSGNALILSTSKVRASVDLMTGRVSFSDLSGRLQLTEYGLPTFTRVLVDGAPLLSVTQQFNRGTDEGLFGLGQHQFGQMNYNGEDVELAQHNM